MELPRSTFYRATIKATKLSDTELVTLIQDIQDELPRYGYRRVSTAEQNRALERTKSTTESGGAKTGHGSGGIVRPRAE